jgi:ribokinase
VRHVELIGCGALNVDLIYRLPRECRLWERLGPPGSEQVIDAEVRAAVDEELLKFSASRSGGGQAANTACAMARLGYATTMVGRVGDDEDGRFLLDELRPADGSLLARRGVTGRVYVLLDEDGERRNLVAGGANDQFVPADLPADLPQARFALFTSFVGDRPLAAQLALLERLPAGTEVAFDPGELYAHKGLQRVLPILSRCAYLFANERELEMLCSRSLPESLELVLKAGVRLVICKMGSRGARLVGRGVDVYVPPLPAEVVDVTGAGDVFAAGFLAALTEGLGLEGAGRLGAWAASRGIEGLGRSSYPDAAAWRERLGRERSAAVSGDRA